MLTKVMLRVAILLSVYLVSNSAQVVRCANGKAALTNSDKAAIIQLAMELKLKSEGPLKFSEYLIISTENMSASWMPRIPGFQFKLMRPSEIRKRQKRAERFRYVIMDELKEWNGRSLRFDLAIIERCGGLPCHSHVYKYNFERVDNQWRGRIFMVIC
jgi:hypothetical protein